MQPIKRREMLAGLGAGTLLSFGLFNQETKAAGDLFGEIDFWKYAKIDPAKAADLAYQIYPDGACMYSAVRALLTTVADAQQAINPMAAMVMMQFPFDMMKYGSGGIGGIGSTCGAFNGAAAVIGLFVKDTASRSAMIQDFVRTMNKRNCRFTNPKTMNSREWKPSSPNRFCATFRAVDGEWKPMPGCFHRNAKIVAAA